MDDSLAAHAGDAHAGHDDPHNQVKPSKRATYIGVFLTLGFLTFLEIYVPEVYSADWSSTTKMLLLCILAIVKAGLVAAYFMHLNHESKWTRWIAYSPIYMGGAVIIILLESLYR